MLPQKSTKLLPKSLKNSPKKPNPKRLESNVKSKIRKKENVREKWSMSPNPSCLLTKFTSLKTLSRNCTKNYIRIWNLRSNVLWWAWLEEWCSDIDWCSFNSTLWLSDIYNLVRGKLVNCWLIWRKVSMRRSLLRSYSLWSNISLISSLENIVLKTKL
jgi:hypothetical protein